MNRRFLKGNSGSSCLFNNLAGSTSTKTKTLAATASSYRALGSVAAADPPKIDVSKLVIKKTKTPKRKGDLESYLFGRVMSDHMLEITWNNRTNTWTNPVISEHKPLEISPAAPCLHYGIQCFEGMKAYKDDKGTIRMFRPDMNMKRMNYSMQRLAMPSLDQEGFLECIKELVRCEGDWIPVGKGYSIYIRPTAIGISPHLGVQETEDVKLFVILSPSGPYFKSGFSPVRLFADTDNVRAWPGGAGNAKVGGNYAPSIAPARNAMIEHGCQQVLWLFGEDHEVTEVGAMNIFFVVKNKENPKVLEVITAPLSRGDILPGVTRDSILTMIKDGTMGTDVVAVEKSLPMREIVEAESDGRLVEIFGAGTAAVLQPVKGIVYQGKEINPSSGEKVGQITEVLYQKLHDIQYGVTDHPWSVSLN